MEKMNPMNTFKTDVDTIVEAFRFLNRVMPEKLIERWIEYALPLLSNPKGLNPYEYMFLLSNT
jgi:hypothetical protein